MSTIRTNNQFLSLFKRKTALRVHLGQLFLRVVIPAFLLFSLTVQVSLAHEVIPESPIGSSTAWNIQFVDASPYIDKMTSRSLAFKPSSGNPCIAFGGDHLYYSCRSSGVWDTIVVDGSTRVGEYAALAFNNNSLPYISYYDVTNKKLKLAYHDGVAWQVLFVPDHPTVPTMPEEEIEQIEETSEQPAQQTEQPVQVTEQPVQQTEQLVQETEQPVQETEQPVPETEQPVQQTEQPVQQTEQPVPETEQPEQEPFELELRKFLQPWLAPLLEPETVVQSPDFDYEETPGVGKHTSIDVDHLNRIHITYEDDLDSSFWYVRWLGGSDWYFKLVDYYPDRLRVGLWSSVAVDENLGVHISYMSEKYDSLKYANRKPNGNWKQCTVDGKAPGGYSNWNSVGAFSSIALDDDNRPHISYYDLGKYDLKHAWLADEECYEGVHRANYNRGWKTETVDSDGKVGWYTSIVVNSVNGIFVSYYDASSSELKYAYRTEKGSWAKKVLHKGWGNNGHLTSIALTGGHPGISYFNAEKGLLQYTRCTGSCTDVPDSKWDGPSTVYNAYFRDVGLSTSIAVKSSGSPYISYLDTSSGYQKYALSLGSSWGRRVLLTSPHAGLFSSIQLYGDTYPRIAFYDTDHKDLMWAKYDSTGWHFSRVDKTYDVGQYISMALDSNGRPHMSYYDATNKNLIYAYWKVSASDWVTQTLDKTGDVGLYTSIALDASDKPYISYYDASHNSLKYAFKTAIDAWKFVTVDDDPTDVLDLGLYTSIIVKGSYQPYITYYEYNSDTENGDLKYAYSTDPDGEVWNIDYVDNSVNDLGMWSSLKWYPAGDSLHVCYYDATDKDLMYAKGTGAGAITWVIQKVDQEGDVGLFCSMGLTGAGLPEISYYDNSGGDLKIALDSGIVLPAAGGQVFIPIALDMH